jgi:hypothetical protein
MLNRQVGEGPVELLAVSYMSRLVSDVWLESKVLHAGLEAPTATRFVGRSSNQDAVQPTVEARDVAQSGQLAPTSNERFLNCIFRQLRVTEDEPGDRMQAIDLAGGELSESLPIAPPCSLYEFLAHELAAVREPTISTGI